MAIVDGNENLSTQFESWRLIVDNIFSTTGHRKTEKREEWLVNWIFKEEHFKGRSTIPEVAESRINFLRDEWSSMLFRPFDDQNSATKYLIQNPMYDIVIRLSATIPGAITVSFRQGRSKPDCKIVNHTRYFLSKNGKLLTKNDKGKEEEHPSLESFGAWFTLTKYKVHFPLRFTGRDDSIIGKYIPSPFHGTLDNKWKTG